MNRHIEDPVDATPLEVIVYRHGEVVDRQPCDSQEEAAAVVARLEEEDGVTCEIIAASAADVGSDDIEKPDDPDDVIDPRLEAGMADDEYR